MENYIAEKPNSKLAAVLSYLGIIGFIAAYLIRDKECEFTRHHINQSLCIYILSIIGLVIGKFPVFGFLSSLIVDAVVIVLWLLGIMQALKGEWKPLPVIKEIEILK